ncbi:YceI family protein [Polaribacter sp. R2A056_3_33]|uniref:YceI family protein n=1 Tax=Polaribacter sp. R2A056_3_33 TaxID=2745563 RepID=UPI001C4E4341|nr:YceI family protein [Polaribacter sp. R2A056_3_33]QXP69828.1 YceI family protein [Polaribacter sp. R2A056_3_33]
MKKSFLTIVAVIAISLTSFAQKQVSTNTHLKFFSSTPAEDIEANNFKAVSTIDTNAGNIVFSVPMQSFEFEKSLMQKHFNSEKFLNTKANPKAKLIGKVVNIEAVKFSKNGTYTAKVEGSLTINGVSKPITENVKFTITEGKINLTSKFNITLADYEVAFEKGKPSTNIAKTVEVTVEANY